MPFLYTKNKNLKQKTRYVSLRNPHFIKRVSPATSYLKGSLTVEAALAVPLFLAGMIAFIFLIQVILIQTRIQTALFSRTLEVSGYAYYIDKTNISGAAEHVLEAEYIKQAVIKEVGKEYLDNSYIVGGSSGININLLKEYKQGVIDVELVYKVGVPFNLFGIKPITYTARAVCHTWTGRDEKAEYEVGEYVYVTSNGEVYHTYKDCSYLDIEVSSCKLEDIGEYEPCKNCCKENQAYKNVYYTKYGLKYHSTTLCGNLHRNIFYIDLDSAKAKYELCNRCEKR